MAWCPLWVLCPGTLCLVFPLFYCLPRLLGQGLGMPSGIDGGEFHHCLLFCKGSFANQGMPSATSGQPFAKKAHLPKTSILVVSSTSFPHNRENWGCMQLALPMHCSWPITKQKQIQACHQLSLGRGGCMQLALLNLASKCCI